MHFHTKTNLLIATVLFLSVAKLLHAADRQIILHDSLNLQWTNELVTFPFSANKGEGLPESITLTGPKGIVPVQLIEIERWPGTKFVRKAKVAFVADLAPLSTDAYTLQFGPRVMTTAALTSDLHIVPSDGQVEMTNGKFGMKLLLGEKQYNPAVLSNEVPGPVLGMRLPDGTWFGGSRMYGPGKITGYSARVLESGPVLGKMQFRYLYEGGRTITLTVQLAAGYSHATWDMNVTPYDRELAVKLVAGAGWAEGAKVAEETAVKDGWQLLLSSGLDPLRFVFSPEFGEKLWAEMKYVNGAWTVPTVDVPLDKEKPGAVVYLTPWNDWWDGRTKTAFTFKTDTRGEVFRIEALDPGDWVEPAPPGTWASFGNVRMRHKWVPLVRGEDGSVSFNFSAASGVRRWQLGSPVVGVSADAAGKDATKPLNTLSVNWPLNRVKDLVLDWPGDAGKHPRLYFSKTDLERMRRERPPEQKQLDELLNYVKVYGYINVPTYRDPNAMLAYLLTGSREIAQKVNLVERMRTYFGRLGDLDRMRSASQLASMYDALIDTDLLTSRDRKLFQAQLAFLTYYCSDAENWSMERGYASGNQNMSVAHILNQGVLAATIPEHPLAKEWSKSSLAMMEKWLNESIGPAGEWPESMANYAEVSASMLVVYAVAAKNAGLHDFVNDPRLKRLMLYMGKQYTPPDPRPFKDRTEPVAGSPPSGRGPAYHPVTGLFGVMAKATAQSDPPFSKAMQWLWLRGGKSTGYLSDRMSGLESIACDPSVPAEVPAWTADRFPQVGAVLRHGLGTPEEYYINFVLEPKAYFVYSSESGGFPGIWAKGVPVSVRFAGHGYGEREELLISRVLLARETGDLEYRKKHFMYDGPMAMTDFAPLPRQDYVAANLRMERPHTLWHDDHTHTDILPVWPKIAQAGKPPVDWRRQLLFLKDDAAVGVNYLLLRDTVSGGQPTMWQFWTLSQKIGTQEEVKDLDKFLMDKPGNKPANARELKGDRFTAVGQLGVDVEYYIASPTDTPRHTLRWGHTYYYFYSEYQDMLHLQLPGDGAYFVAFYPRKRSEEIPTFSTLGEGRIIKVSGSFGIDYGFLSETEAESSGEGVYFRGTVASVQDRKNGLVLSLNAKGEIRYRDYGIASENAVSLRVGAKTLTVQLPIEHQGTPLTITAPGSWQLAAAVKNLTLVKTGADRFTLTVPVGRTSVELKEE